MIKLRGQGLNSGIAMGTVAVIRTRNGRPIPPAIPPRVAAQLARRREEDTPDLVLVAEDYAVAVAFVESIRWGNVVGIVAGPTGNEVEADSPLPTVVGVPDPLDSLKEDMLVIVDTGRGVVFGDPDGILVAQYQAERNRLAPKRRLYLGTAHLPAQTLDGRTLQVYARVASAEDIEAAIDAGADGLFVPEESSLLPDLSGDTASGTALQEVVALSQRSQQDDEPEATDRSDHPEFKAALRQLLALAASKPLLIANAYNLPPKDLLLAAVQADITLAGTLMPHLEGQGIGELGQELNEARADLLANDALCEMPRLAVDIPPVHPIPLEDPELATFFMDRLAYNGASRLFISLDNDQIDPDTVGWLSDVVAAANTAMLPVFVHWIVWLFNFGAFGGESDEDGLSEDATITLQWLIGTGIGGIVVTPADVRKIKQAIRAQNYSECRDVIHGSASANEARDE